GPISRRAPPRGPPALRGSMRQLPQAATDRYLSRIVTAMQHWRPGIPVVLMGPSPWSAPTYPVQRTHPVAVEAGRRWAHAHGVAFVDVDPLVAPALRAGQGNPDGLHWAWSTHERVGRALAEALLAASSGNVHTP
ncbi:MAG: hypothetical protein ACKOE2_13580, partial [Actinomycetales bacterium]